MKKITIIPETLSQLPKRDREPLVSISVRIPLELDKKLTTKQREYGYNRQELVALALEAFLK